MSRVWLPLAASALCGSAVSAQSIVNGDFAVSVPSNGSGGGWTSAHIDGLGGWQDAGGDRGGYFILNEGGDPSTDPTIWQTVAGLTPGWVYMISGEYASWYVNGYPSNFPESFEARINGLAQFQAPPTDLRVWTPFEFLFLADAESVGLLFAAEANSSDNDFAIDNISITPIPAPAGLIPLAALILLRRR